MLDQTLTGGSVHSSAQRSKQHVCTRIPKSSLQVDELDPNTITARFPAAKFQSLQGRPPQSHSTIFQRSPTSKSAQHADPPHSTDNSPAVHTPTLVPAIVPLCVRFTQSPNKSSNSLPILFPLRHTVNRNRSSCSNPLPSHCAQ